MISAVTGGPRPIMAGCIGAVSRSGGKARLLEFLDGSLSFNVRFENRHDGIFLGHNVGAFVF
jgi:hypothetical protein